VGAAALAAVGVVATVSPAVVSASPQQALNWTEQHPVTSPSARLYTQMAYDAATGTAVLFSGQPRTGTPSDTWTWNGTTWVEHLPAAHPVSRIWAAMAYDAATDTVVLFGGAVESSPSRLDDTWTWNGKAWAEQHPATSPPAMAGAVMTYDAATRTVVLFDQVGDTWTWNGTTWTKQHPADHPSARGSGAMVYDAATGTVVLFGGLTYTTACNNNTEQVLQQTWTWG
jgi:hypothetical protein